MTQRKGFLWMALLLILTVVPLTALAETDTEFTKVVLKNGLTLMYKVMKNQPNVSIYAIVPIGSNTEKEKGISHLLEHLVFRGGSGFTFNDILEVTNRQGGQFNGYTTFYATIYNYITPKANYEAALRVFNGSLWKPDLAEKTVALEQKIVIHEAELDYSQSYQYYPVIHYFYPENLYTKEMYLALSPGDLLDFHRNYYQPANVTYVVAGDIDPRKLMAELEKITNGYGTREITKQPVVSFDLPDHDVVESRNLYPYQYQLMMAYELSGLTPKERMILKILAVFYGYDFKINYEQNEYKGYNVVTRSVGDKDYFGIYYLERKHPYSPELLAEERKNLAKYFREFRKMDFKKKQKELVDLIQRELIESKVTAEDAVEYEVQKLINPDDLTVDSLPVLKSLKPQDLEAVINKYFSKPPTSWILVTTNKTAGAGGK